MLLHTYYSLLLFAAVSLSINTVYPFEHLTNINTSIDLSGKYVGGWTSTTPKNQYDKIPISAILHKSDVEGQYNGEFFFTEVHYSCCKSGKNDGSLTLKVDGSNITHFEYSDILPRCHGFFSGTGQVDSIGTLQVDFTGYDCEGKHRESSLTLRKQQNVSE